MKQIAIDSWNDYYRYQNSKWLSAMYMTKEQLQTWMNKEMADGRTLERFKVWEAKHPKRKHKTGS